MRMVRPRARAWPYQVALVATTTTLYASVQVMRRVTRTEAQLLFLLGELERETERAKALREEFDEGVHT
jgi:hypothetical protein